MTYEEAKKYWEYSYDVSKDFYDDHWEASERNEHREYVEAQRLAVEALEKVEAEPVRHGHWIDSESRGEKIKRCSCCGGTSYSYYYTTKYCGDCGAKMDLNGEDNV